MRHITASTRVIEKTSRLKHEAAKKKAAYAACTNSIVRDLARKALPPPVDADTRMAALRRRLGFSISTSTTSNSPGTNSRDCAAPPNPADVPCSFAPRSAQVPIAVHAHSAAGLASRKVFSSRGLKNSLTLTPPSRRRTLTLPLLLSLARLGIRGMMRVRPVASLSARLRPPLVSPRRWAPTLATFRKLSCCLMPLRWVELYLGYGLTWPSVALPLLRIRQACGRRVWGLTRLGRFVEVVRR